MRKISLKKEYSTPTKVCFGVMDPEGRKRCTMDIDFSPYDLGELKAKGMDAVAAAARFEDELKEMISGLIGKERECSGGWEDIMGPVREAVTSYFGR